MNFGRNFDDSKSDEYIYIFNTVIQSVNEIKNFGNFLDNRLSGTGIVSV